MQKIGRVEIPLYIYFYIEIFAFMKNMLYPITKEILNYCNFLTIWTTAFILGRFNAPHERSAILTNRRSSLLHFMFPVSECIIK